jgi:hypothetical protein
MPSFLCLFLLLKLLIYKHYRVFRYSIGDKEKSFITHVKVLRLFFLSSTYLENKLVCLSVPCFSAYSYFQNFDIPSTVAYFDTVSVTNKKVLQLLLML